MPDQVGAMTQGMIEQGMAKGVKAMNNPQCLGAQTYAGGRYGI